MKRLILFSLVIILAVAFSACSSSQKSGEDVLLPDEIIAEEAKTDPVPSEQAGEQIQPTGETQAADATSSSAPEDAAVALPPPAPAEAAQPQTAEASPAEEPAQTTPQPSVSGHSEDYSVQAGDTLMKIAFETYGDLYQWKKIYEANKDRISDPNAVAQGTVLRIEAPATRVTIERNGDKYFIKYGDTLGKISDDLYGTKRKWRRLWENNRQLIHDPNKIFAGFYLYYTMTEEERQDINKLKQEPAPLVEQQPIDSAPAVSAAAPTDIQNRAPASSDAAAPAATQPAQSVGADGPG
jgi:LysM repeat protein